MSKCQKIRTRSEIPEEDTWAIGDLYASDALWEEAFLTLDEDARFLKSFEGRLSGDAKSLFEYLSAMELLEVKADRLGNYCMRRSDENTRDSFYQAMVGRFVSKMVEIRSALSFETPEILTIPDARLAEFYAQVPELTRFRRYLTDLRRFSEHVLSPVEEKLLSAAGELAQAPDTVYGVLADADLTFADAADAEGEMHQVTQGTFVLCEQSPDRVLRKNAYESLYAGFSAFRNTAAALLDAQNKQLKFFANARKYPSAFEAAMDATNVPPQVYHTLIDTVHAHLDKLHRYVALRKKMLGVDDLHFYDIYTPLVADVEKDIPFEQAKQTVYEALDPLGEEYRAILKQGFENRWIDVYQNEGKRSGAYSAGASVHPYVLLNYTGTLDSQFTLAHEMGHALHSYYSNSNQNPIDADYVIFVAEVASTCNEALLMQALLEKTTDQRERAYLINYFLDQFKGTLYRQTMFAEFELTIGQMVQEGKTLTADVLCDCYRKINEVYYGKDMVVDDSIAVEWARIPHFYYHYYVYQYATGYAAAIALSRRILHEGEPAVRDYLKFLSGGCSQSPIELLKIAGVDMTTSAPIEQALALFGQLLDEMEKLTEETK